jgi:signal peptidase II
VAKLIVLAILFFFDYESKIIIFNLINLNNLVYVTSFLDLVHIHNYGVSFGLFSGIFSSMFFIFIGLVISILVLILMLKSKKKLEKWGYLFIIAGALSNILDRFLNGYVIDFIYLHFRNFDWWPAFNFADIYITIGICMILSQIFFDLKKR